MWWRGFGVKGEGGREGGREEAARDGLLMHQSSAVRSIFAYLLGDPGKKARRKEGGDMTFVVVHVLRKEEDCSWTIWRFMSVREGENEEKEKKMAPQKRERERRERERKQISLSE